MTLTMTGVSPTTRVEEANTGRRRCRSNCSDETLGASTRCTVTFGSGARTTGMTATRALTRKAGPGRRAKARTTFVAVVPGFSMVGACVPLPVAGGISVTVTTVAVLPEVLRAQASQSGDSDGAIDTSRLKGDPLTAYSRASSPCQSRAMMTLSPSRR